MLTFIWALTSIWVPYKIDVGNFFANVIMLFSIFVNNCLVLTWIGLFQKKSKQRRGEMEYTFLNPPNGIFRFFTLPLEIPKKPSPPGNSEELYDGPWKFQSQKPRSMEIPREFFLNTPGISTSLLTDSWNFHMLFFNTPLNCYFYSFTYLF